MFISLNYYPNVSVVFIIAAECARFELGRLPIPQTTKYMGNVDLFKTITKEIYISKKFRERTCIKS